jgi:hypothetical protein
MLEYQSLFVVQVERTISRLMARRRNAFDMPMIVGFGTVEKPP